MINDRLEIDPARISRQIERFLRDKLKDLDRQGIIVGLSGGFDSAVAAYLSIRAIGAEKVRLLNMPERDSKDIHRRHAELIARRLGIPLEVMDLSSILEEMGIYDLLPISAVPGKLIRQATVQLGRSLLGLDRANSILEARFRSEGDSLIARGNAYAMSKHRLRMILLYKQADISNLMVVGAANRTELMTGTFSQWGCDQCADVMPLVHLYRSQLYPLAKFLEIPKAILNKAADPDILPGVNDKEKLLGSFSEVDRVLMALEMGMDRGSLVDSYDAELVDRLVDLAELSRPMRESPYVLSRGG